MNSLDTTGGPGAIQPQYSTDLSASKGEKVHIKISDTQGNKIIVWGKTIKKAEKAGKTIKKAKKAGKTIKKAKKMTEGTKIQGNTVQLNVTDTTTQQTVRVAVKIKDLAERLEVSTNLIKNAVRVEEFDRIVSDNLKLQTDLQQQPSSLQRASVLDPQVRAGLVSSLGNYGLTQDEFDTIELFYANNKDDLDALTEPTHIRGDKEVPPLSRSLVYVPEGPRKGMYVLLKTHGGVGEIGLGAFNRATLALHLDTGQKKVFRNAKKEDVPDQEFEANKRTVGHPNHFAAGVPVSYKGPWRERRVREKNMPKDHIPREENVEKVGFIMDFIEGGDLFDRLYTDPGPKLTYKEKVGIAYQYAQHVACLNDELGLVHLDQKAENTFMTKNGEPRLADFGYTVKKGTQIGPCGTTGLIAPEVVMANFKPYKADFPADVWSMGCVLADLMGTPWFDMNGQSRGDPYLILDIHVLNHIKEKCFPDRGPSGTMDFVIDWCLELHPSSRPTASRVAELLGDIYNNL